MAESEEEATRSEGVLGTQLQLWEESGRRAREERMRRLQFSSDDDEEGAGGGVMALPPAHSPTPLLQSQGGTDDDLDGAPVIRADDEEEEEEDWDMDAGETPDCTINMETDRRTDADRRADSDRRADTDRRTDVDRRADSDRRADTERCVGVDRQTELHRDRPASERSRPRSEGSETGACTITSAPGLGTGETSENTLAPGLGTGGAVVLQSESREVSRRQGEDTPVSISPPQPGVPRIRETGSGTAVSDCFFPLVDIKDEPIDEEYDRALVPPPPPRRIKEEPDALEELGQQQKTLEELRISSVFSVGDNASPPTVPAVPPLCSPSRAARASAAPPRVPQTDSPAAPAPPALPVAPGSATPPSAVRVSCSGCTKVLMKGQMAFQRKGSSQLFCSTVCLTGCTLPPAPKTPVIRKTCATCLKEIGNPKDVIIAPVDRSGTVKDFCSQACLSSYDVKRQGARPSEEAADADAIITCSVCKKTDVINHEVNFQGAVHKLCSDACFTRFRSSNNLTMNCCETCGVYCYSGVGTCQLLQLEGAVRKFCGPPCLAAYKQKSGRVVPCAACQSPRPVGDMVEGPGPESKILLYCSGACAANANGAPQTSIAGASFPCTSCRLLAVPQFHLALTDGSIRNFCSYNCVLTFQAGLNKALPPGQVNGNPALPEPLPVPPSAPPLPLPAPPLPPQASATLPPLSAPRHVQAPPLGPSPAPTPPSPVTRVHGPALPAAVPPGPASAQAPPPLPAGPAPPSHGPVKLSCRHCRRLFCTKPELLQLKDQMELFCGRPCVEAYRKLNSVTVKCEYCQLDKVLQTVVKFNHVDQPFCSEGCKLLFKHDLAKRTGNPCRTCSYCTNMAQKMIQNHFGGKLEEFCKEECMALYTVLYYQMAKCDWCLRQGKLLESQKWLGEMKHFCDLPCLLLFDHQQSSSTYDQQDSQSSSYDRPQSQPSHHEPPKGKTSPYDQQHSQTSPNEQSKGKAGPSEQPQAQPGRYDHPQGQPSRFDQPHGQPGRYDQLQGRSSPYQHSQTSRYDLTQGQPRRFDQPQGQSSRFDQPQAYPSRYDQLQGRSSPYQLSQPGRYDQPQGHPSRYDQPLAHPSRHEQPQGQTSPYDQPPAYPRRHDQPPAQPSRYDQLQGQSSRYDQPQGQSSRYNQPQGQTSPYDQPPAYPSRYDQPQGQTCQSSQTNPYEQKHTKFLGSIALPPYIPTGGGVPTCLAPLPLPAGAPAVPPPPYASKEATPVIANVVSLASAPTGQPYVTANTALPGAVPTTLNQARINGDASTQTDAMKLPAAPRRVLKNKALLCKPISQNKGTICKPHQSSVESQTDEVHGQKILVLPVPVPVFIPVPMHLYSQYTPLPVGLPLPLPVPMFIPPSLDRTESSACPPPDAPPDHRMAEEEEEVKRDTPVSYGVASDQGSKLGGDLKFEGVATAHSGGEEPSSGKQRLGAAGQKDTPASSAPPPLLDLEADFPLESLGSESGKGPGVNLRLRGCRKPRDSFPPRKRGRKRAAAVVASGVARAAMPPAGRSKLIHMYGVNAWKSWVQKERENGDRRDKESSVRLKEDVLGCSSAELSVGLKEDVLGCSSAELSVGMCRFIAEVRRPNGERYAPDSIFYLCLGIQQYLFESGRIENLFTDPLYRDFSLQITGMLRDWKPAAVSNGRLLSRVEEEFLWECKQLGAYSPIVLLNTLLFFCTKLLHLRTLPEHRDLAFTSLRRVTRQDTHTSYLRYTPPPKARAASVMTPLPVKRRLKEEEDEEDEEEDVMEMMMSENTENPLRCPVRLYEFYLSKCPDSVKQSRELFYLQPEHSCMPNSRLWYSSQPLDGGVLNNMLTRILTVQEVHQLPAAMLHSNGDPSD